jgi:hypothetical protein
MARDGLMEQATVPQRSWALSTAAGDFRVLGIRHCKPLQAGARLLPTPPVGFEPTTGCLEG